MSEEKRHRRRPQDQNYLKAIKLLLEPQLVMSLSPQYPLSLLDTPAKYLEKDLTNSDVEDYKKSLRVMNIKQTMYERQLTPVDNIAGLKGPGRVCIIKFMGGFSKEDGSGEVFFFVFKNYEQRLSNRRELMNEVYTTLKPKLDNFRVRDLNEVIVNGLLGLYLEQDEDAGVIEGLKRIRIISINRSTGTINYWAVDEGFLGTCNFYLEDHLYCLNDLSVGLDMLVIPGTFGSSDNAPGKVERFKSGKYCFAKVLEPCLSVDFGVRKIFI